MEFSNITEKLYFGNESEKRLLLWELICNANRILDKVVIFNKLAEFGEQFHLTKPQDALFWEIFDHEMLLDRVRISIAFETYNKYILLKKGCIVHNLKEQKEKKKQRKMPLLLSELGVGNFEDFSVYVDETNTLPYSITLEAKYQEVINLPTRLIEELKTINQQRNNLHLFVNFRGKIDRSNFIENWEYCKVAATTVIRCEKEKLAFEISPENAHLRLWNCSSLK